MIEVKKVIRQDKVAKQVTIMAGCVEITYILNQNQRLQEISRLNYQAQILTSESLYISPADSPQAVKTASAILKRKT